MDSDQDFEENPNNDKGNRIPLPPSTFEPSNNFTQSTLHNQPTNHTISQEGQQALRPQLRPFVAVKSSNIPHQGSLCRVDRGPEYRSSVANLYEIQIILEDGSRHELRYEQQHYDFMSRLFAILDTESRGSVGRAAVAEFVTLRCPVFCRRDNDMRRLGTPKSSVMDSPTFAEVWRAVSQCSREPITSSERSVEIGVEGWMVFCRFIALAQYLEAKRRFSARHLQQTMRHRNSPRGSELVMVDVPPAEPPTSLSAGELAEYERKAEAPLPLPELDLDHSLVGARDVYTYRNPNSSKLAHGKVQISPFGSTSLIQTHLVASSSSSSFSTAHLEFAVTFTPSSELARDGSWSSLSAESILVRRSFEDIKWLHDTFVSHKLLGGTLCGRILPPFPSTTLAYQSDDSRRNSTGKGSGSAQIAMEAAAAGVGILTSVAKTFWGSYVSQSHSSRGATSQVSSHRLQTKKKGNSSRNVALPESYFNTNSPDAKARQLERYLNYLLEHPALSTSFALNTILKASQSGLDAAKQAVRDHSKALKRQQSQAPQLEDGKIFLNLWPSSSHPASQGSANPNLSWVRTAAQAAMALQLHGILETSGMPSASARLQHASLPNFRSTPRNTAWADEDERQLQHQKLGHDNTSEPFSRPIEDTVALTSTSETEEAESFERGVVQVESELGAAEGVADELTFGDEGYDLLPLPVPAPERRILCAGSAVADSGRLSSDVSTLSSASTGSDKHSARFYYGSHGRRLQSHAGGVDGSQPAYLEDFAVDDDIDKLREVIGSVDNTLSRCLAASGGIAKARRKSHLLHLDLVRGFDSWEGLRGKFIAQRALLKGVSGLEQSRDVSEESDFELMEDISWQTSLASSAVSAAEDVRSTVRTARTAVNAKAAADSAFLAAQSACESGKFSSVGDARAAQTRASIAQSHAIHAAVVDHEARSAKRRAALALAHDVKCWNVHRKRELLQTCLRSARSQLEASRRAVDAWSCLRDGYVGSPVIPYADSCRIPYRVDTRLMDAVSACSEASATVFSDAIQSTSEENADAEPSIQAVDHQLLSCQIGEDASSEPGNTPAQTDGSCFDEQPNKSQDLLIFASDGSEMAPPESSPFYQFSFDATESTAERSASKHNSEESPPSSGEHLFQSRSAEETDDREKLSASMQSLVDGLMAWGGQYDSEDDVALPNGMAASIAFEESGLLG